MLKQRGRPAIVAAAAGTAVLLVVGAAVWSSFRGDDSTGSPPSTARRNQDPAACLLVDDRGIAGPAGAPAWAGMREASGVTRVRVQYVAAAGPQTAENVAPYLAGLAQSRCSVVVAAGEAPLAAVQTSAGQFPHTKFLLVGGRSAGTNVTALDAAGAEAVQAAVKKAVVSATTH